MKHICKFTPIATQNMTKDKKLRGMLTDVWP